MPHRGLPVAGVPPHQGLAGCSLVAPPPLALALALLLPPLALAFRCGRLALALAPRLDPLDLAPVLAGLALAAVLDRVDVLLAGDLCLRLRLERTDLGAAGEVETAAVGGHRVVLAELVLEFGAAVSDVEADRADVGSDAADVGDVAEHRRGADHGTADAFRPADVAVLRVHRVEPLVERADEDGRPGAGRI